MKMSFSKKEYVIFPKISILYVCLAVGILFLYSFCFEFFLLSPLKEKGVVSYSSKWEQENELINIDNYAKRGFTVSDCVYNDINNPLSLINSSSTNIKNCCINDGKSNFYKKNFSTDYVWKNEVYKVYPVKQTSKRILVIGDSYVWGNGYSNLNDLWWRRLQQELVNRGYNDVEVIASGWDGLNTAQELANLKRILKIYNPDIVVWGYVTNDPDSDIVKSIFGNGYNKVFSQDKILKVLDVTKFVFPNLSAQLRNLRLKTIQDRIFALNNGETIYVNYSEWEEALLKGENLERYKKTLRDVKSYMTKNSDVPMFFVTLPNLPYSKYYNPKYDEVLPLFRQNNIKIYNIFPSFKKEYPRVENGLKWRINPANGHPSLLVTSFYAKKVADILETDYLKALPKKNVLTTKKELLINDWMPMSVSLKQNNKGLSFTYPEKTQGLLSMPYGYNFVQLNFSYPVNIDKLKIYGEGLSKSRVDFTYDNPEDTHVYQLKRQRGKNVCWQNFAIKGLIRTIRINAEFENGKKRDLTISFEGKDFR